MRLQLNWPGPAFGAAVLLVASSTAADSSASTTTTFFHESGGSLSTTVVMPSVSVAVDVDESVGIEATWEADIVSGASVAIVDAPSAGVDAVSGASMSDLRQTVGGAVELRGDHSAITLGYSYGFENDYRSHALRLGARTELFERNTVFEIDYTRGFDEACNLAQPGDQDAVNRQRLTNSDGCFEADDRTEEDLSTQTFRGAWTQVWSPVLTSQLTLTAQLLHGYQGNPYRAVWLGRLAAQEHHPDNRARYAAGLEVRVWLKALEGVLSVSARAYRDTWDVESLTGQIYYEQILADGLRLRARGRLYTQTGAAFYSDDYGFFPRGQYFTGDRELSPMRSITLGGRIQWSLPASDDGSVLGFLSALDLVGKADYVLHDFSDFHYDRAEVPNPDAIIATFALEATF